MNKNELVRVTIEDFTKSGEGIGHANGYTLFVKDALIGDTVLARITKSKKGYAYARVETIETSSPFRVKAQCPEARRCGGCTLQEYDYAKQLEWKRAYVESVMRRIGGFPELEVRPVLGMNYPFRYRNKAQYPIAEVRDGRGGNRAAAGFYAGRTHYLIEIEDCLLSPETDGEILRRFLLYMKNQHVPAYNEETHTGLVRHLLIRHGAVTGEILVCPVINGKVLPSPEKLIRALRDIPGMKSICVNINTRPGNVILGDRTFPLYGKAWITDNLLGHTFRISPRSFYQVNHAQAEVLYREALAAADLRGNETVFDLYCGIGTIALTFAPLVKEVYGVEIVPDAVADARMNAKENGLLNAQFYAGAAEDLVVSGSFSEHVPCPHPDIVILDPPRKGCASSLIEAVRSLDPGRIVYVSCDPATLARDLRLFAPSYRPLYAQPVDMFPQGPHIECVVPLERSNGTH